MFSFISHKLSAPVNMKVQSNVYKYSFVSKIGTGESTDPQEIVTGPQCTKSEINLIQVHIVSFPTQNDCNDYRCMCGITSHYTKPEIMTPLC
jgi:hypothetical protein